MTSLQAPALAVATYRRDVVVDARLPRDMLAPWNEFTIALGLFAYALRREIHRIAWFSALRGGGGRRRRGGTAKAKRAVKAAALATSSARGEASRKCTGGETRRCDGSKMFVRSGETASVFARCMSECKRGSGQYSNSCCHPLAAHLTSNPPHSISQDKCRDLRRQVSAVHSPHPVSAPQHF